MSAAAPALVRSPSRPVMVRIGDPAVAVAYLSVVFGLLLVFFPVSFPEIIVKSWALGRLTPAMMVLALLLDAGIYVRVAHLRSAKPGLVASACLGSVPIMIVVGLSFLLQASVSHTLSGYLPNVQARVNEEILAQTYFGLVSAVFFPFLLIRFTQQFKIRNS
jgi:hypothetical protein